jgi:RNA polymerase sigma-70 factor (ECF subfamily)
VASPVSTSGADDPAQLLARTALGDRAAFERLYQRTAAQLLGVVLRVVHRRDAAEDILQEVYVAVWRNAASFNPALAQASTWLIAIARHRAIDSLRRAQAAPRMISSTVAGDDGEDDRDLLHDFASDAPGPAEQLESAGDARALRNCMGTLSRDQQQVLALAFFQGASYPEVAAHLRQPLGTVKSWVRRGLIALKGCLERGSGALPVGG